MSAFGGMVLTNRGRNLQAKGQAGAQLNFTRFGVGDGELGGSSILELNSLKHQVKSVNISKAKAVAGGKATIGMVLSNQDLVTGFYFREIGLFAQDPDIGEILYCYANSGATADYIPAGGGADVVEKSFDVIAIVGTVANVTTTIDGSLVYASAQELLDHENDTTAHGLAGKISHSLATAANDFLVASGAGVFVKKTLTQVKTILGLGGAAYKDIGVAGGVASYDTLETHLADTMKYSIYKINKDSNGIYTEVQLKRTDGTLIMKSILSGGASPKYTQRTETYYDKDGNTVIDTKIYSRTYGTDDELVSEVML